MPFIGRTEVGDLIQPQVYTGIFDGQTPYNSVVMTLGDRIEVGTKETIIPIVGTLPVAEFVEKTGTQATPTAGTYPAVPVADAPDIGYKPVSNMTLVNARLTLEKIAVIIPIAECVLQDIPDAAAFEELIRRKGEEAIARRFDQAAVLGTNPPDTYGPGIVADATTAGNVVTVAAAATPAERVNALNDAMSRVESVGYTVDGIGARTAFFSTFRSAMISNPNIVYTQDALTRRPVYSFFGIAITEAKVLNGTNNLAIVGQWDNVKWGTRTDYEVKVLSEATVTNADGSIYNLAQQDMIAFRIVLRIGYVVLANTGTYPLAVVQQTA